LYNYASWNFCSAEKFGELSDAMAPIYYHYGDVLLRMAELKSDALGGEGDDASEDDAEEATAAPSSAAAPSASAGAEESKDNDDDDGEAVDQEEEDLEDEVDDEMVAFENLDVARVIVAKQKASKVSDSCSGRALPHAVKGAGVQLAV
jgi:hypothetical protein